MGKFIMITEFDDVYWADNYSDSDIASSEAGVLSIIDLVSMTMHIKDDEWCNISKWE